MRYNPLIGSDLAGHLGGIVASHNTYGVYLKRRFHPVNPKTAGQMAQRTALQIVSQTWRTLDAAVQLAFGAAQVSVKSRKGFVNILTGQALFMHQNLLRQRIGLSLVEDPITDPEPATFTQPSGNVVQATHTLSVTYSAGDPWNASGGGVIVSAAPIPSDGITYWQKFRTVGTTTGATAGAVDYILPFTVAAGQRVRVRYRVTDTVGRMSTPLDVDYVAA